MSTNLLDAALGPMDEQVQAFENVRPSSNTFQFKVPTFNGDGEVELFIEKFQDTANENEWSEKGPLLHPKGCLEELAKRRGKDTDKILNNLQTRYGRHVCPASNGTLSGIKKKFQGSVLTVLWRW